MGKAHLHKLELQVLVMPLQRLTNQGLEENERRSLLMALRGQWLGRPSRQTPQLLPPTVASCSLQMKLHLTPWSSHSHPAPPLPCNSHHPNQPGERPAVPRTRWVSSGLRACGSLPFLVFFCPYLVTWCSPLWLNRELHSGKSILSQKSDMGVPALCSQSHQAPLGIALCLFQVTQCPLPDYSKEPRMQGLGLPAVSLVTSVHVGHSKNWWWLINN